MVIDHTAFPPGYFPKDLEQAYHVQHQGSAYAPKVQVNNFWLLSSQLVEINRTVTELPLALSFEPISLMKWRIQVCVAMCGDVWHSSTSFSVICLHVWRRLEWFGNPRVDFDTKYAECPKSLICTGQHRRVMG
jgi:hypothetical protein